MRVLLLQTRRRECLGFGGFIATEPLGLEVVAASLEGQQVRILDFFDYRAVAKEIVDFKPQAVGISCSFTTDVYKAISLAQIAKMVNPKTFTFVGGHHPSLVPEDFCYPLVDAVVIGDGEASTPSLINTLEEGKDLFGIPGLAINTPDGQVLNPERPLALDLNGLAIPARNLTSRYRKRYHLGLRRPIVAMETSRGCSYHCSFCSIWKFHHCKVRSMSPERVVEEIKTLGPGDVLFTDDNFLSNVERAYQIAELIERRGLHRRYIFQARSDSVVQHPDVIKKWASAGLSGVFIGFEKSNQEGLKSLNKQNSVENNEKALNLLRSLKIVVYASFIVDPAFSLSEFNQLLQYIWRLAIRYPYFTVLTPLPGTDFYKKTKQHLITENYELYDLLHAVLPTKLPLEQFYREFASLYRKTYLTGRHAWTSSTAFLARRLFQARLHFSEILQLWGSIRKMLDPQSYLSTPSQEA